MLDYIQRPLTWLVAGISFSAQGIYLDDRWYTTAALIAFGICALLLKLNKVADKLVGAIAVQQIAFPLAKSYTKRNK